MILHLYNQHTTGPEILKFFLLKNLAGSDIDDVRLGYNLSINGISSIDRG
ncbi:MAG TPA: hypothetical protein VMV49_09405 [Candidatus Deferrimicrobium sp.]|nr:hypothetical protein [Candidatus Deferrimicrobium sp.]